MHWKEMINAVVDFPIPGIRFRDMMPLLADVDARRQALDELCVCAKTFEPDVVVGIESRGFMLGLPIADRLGLSFVPAKSGVPCFLKAETF